ncbi:hypothetical protein B0H13DRAFT_1864229 [Mycena leptocephala]|nr:hypothetical protein B0H13DRAFT_1864229 [Mycena leptocephala]
MQITLLLTSLCALGVTFTVAVPTNGTSNLSTRGLPNQPKCGTAGDAVLSDCRAMLSAPNLALDYSRTCTVNLAEKAYNPICSLLLHNTERCAGLRGGEVREHAPRVWRRGCKQGEWTGIR